MTMATDAQVAQLRKMINEPTTDTYSDDELSALIDELSGSTSAAAAQIWQEKAARYAALTDVQEGNSLRKMSQLQAQALKMAAQYQATEPAILAGSYSRTRAIERA